MRNHKGINNDCPNCKDKNGIRGITAFLRHHILNERWEVRKCLNCSRESVHSSNGLPLMLEMIERRSDERTT
jgi:hypothetical protein